MFASLYGLTTSPAEPDQNSVVKVKVRNLNKATSREDLRSRLSQFNIVDIKPIQSHGDKVNYAYVHLSDHATAKKVVEAIHNKMEIHGHLLRAILREDNPAASCREKLIGNMDKKLVEVLLYKSNISLPRVKDHFSQYGEVESVTIVREGASPSICHVLYSRALSAYIARYEAPHHIFLNVAVALPLPEPLESQSEFKTESFQCDKLILKSVVNDLSASHSNTSRVEFLTKGCQIEAHFHADMTDAISKNVTEAITRAISETSQIKFEMHHSYLPILASLELQFEIDEIKTTHELAVKQGTSFVSLFSLRLAYKKCSNLAENSDIAPYLSPSTTDSHQSQCQWYWQDDSNVFQSYTEEVNRRLEQSYKTTAHLSLEIGRFAYIINFDNRTQTNIRTGKKRAMKCTVVQTSEDVVTLQLRAHKKCIQDCKKQIETLAMSHIKKRHLDVPRLALQMDSFQDTLKQKRKQFLKITLEDDDNTALLIQGKENLVQTALSEFQSLILQTFAEKSFQVTIPNTWEKQSSKCELRNVTQGTSEWKTIEEKILQPRFAVKIIKIERIQNEWLWEVYQLSKKRMSQKNDGKVNEKALFHGTGSTSPRDIYDSEQGFDNRLASKGRWGEGTYFAVSAKYSDAYAHTIENGHKQMFLANVVTGISCQLSSQDKRLKAPPKKEDHDLLLSILETSKFEGERYDSVTGTSNSTQIYVIYELGRVYPAYLITYMK